MTEDREASIAAELARIRGGMTGEISLTQALTTAGIDAERRRIRNADAPPAPPDRGPVAPFASAVAAIQRATTARDYLALVDQPPIRRALTDSAELRQLARQTWQRLYAAERERTP
jgi:hypothetical protein